MKYLALLRGVNVGGNALVKMADLQTALTANGLTDVHTYIQSGNIIFSSDETDTIKLARAISAVIQKRFSLDVITVVFTQVQWQHIIESAPAWWGKEPGWKHNLLILIPPFSSAEAATAIGELKPDIEAMEAGSGVLYQSICFEKFGRTTGGKLASNPAYKKMTIRNFNTSTKLLKLLQP